MRNAMSLVVGAVSLSLLVVACGDASSSSGVQRRPAPTLPGGDDGQESIGENAPDPGNPNADTPPPAPTTPGQSTGELGVALSSATPAIDLGDQLELTVTIEPKAGFKGDADLTATGLPEGATATFTPAKVTLNTTAVTAKLLFKVPVTAVPSAVGASSAVVVTATSGAVKASANASFKINPKLKLTIPLNIDALRSTGTKFLDQWGPAFGAAPTALKTQTGNPIVVTVFNADSKGHIVHGNAGFAHGATTYVDANGVTQNALIAPKAFEPSVAGNPASTPRTQTVAPGAAVNGYPHEGGAGASAGFQLSVVAAP
ncbi:hypothetical protein BH11MYX4_BH11MYX4_43930 [soil metagenome]